MGSFTCDAEALGICASISPPLSPISVYQGSGVETDFSDEYELILRYPRAALWHVARLLTRLSAPRCHCR